MCMARMIVAGCLGRVDRSQVAAKDITAPLVGPEVCPLSKPEHIALHCRKLWRLPAFMTVIVFGQPDTRSHIKDYARVACHCTYRACEHLPPRRPGPVPRACLLALCFALSAHVAAMTLRNMCL